MPRQETPVKSKTSFQLASEFGKGGTQLPYPSRLELNSSCRDHHRLSSVSERRSESNSGVMPLQAALSSNRSSNPQAQSWLSQQVKGVQRRLGKNQPVAPAPSGNGPLIGIIDIGFGPGQHGQQVLQKIQSAHTDSQILLADGVGKGTWADSLTQFVDVAKASGQVRAVANLSFDLTQQNSDGSVTTRQQLTASESKALNYAQKNNVLVVASAGNEGGEMSALGQASRRSDNLIVVGAADGDKRAGYSSFGQGLDFLVSAEPKKGGGTSIAAAETTKNIAELWAANPHLAPHQVVQALEATTKDLKTPGWDAKTGWGLLNPDAAGVTARTLPAQPLLAGLGFQKTPADVSSGGETRPAGEGVIPGERPNRLDAGISRSRSRRRSSPRTSPRAADGRSRSASRVLKSASRKASSPRTSPRAADGRSRSASRILKSASRKAAAQRSSSQISPRAADGRSRSASRILKSASRKASSSQISPRAADGRSRSASRILKSVSRKASSPRISPRAADGRSRSASRILKSASRKAAVRRSSPRISPRAADGRSRSASRILKSASRKAAAQRSGSQISPRAADGRSPAARKILQDARLKTYQRRSRNEHQFHKQETLRNQARQAELKKEKSRTRFHSSKLPDHLTGVLKPRPEEPSGGWWSRVSKTAGEAVSNASDWTRENQETLVNRGIGLVQVVGGTAEAVAGAAGVVTPEPVTTVGGAVLFAHGVDSVATGLNTLLTGKEQKTVTQKAASATARGVGASPENAESFGDAIDFIAGIGSESVVARGIAREGGERLAREGIQSSTQKSSGGTGDFPSKPSDGGVKPANNDASHRASENTGRAPSRAQSAVKQRRFMKEQLNTILSEANDNGSHPLDFLVDTDTKNWRGRRVLSSSNRGKVDELSVQAGHRESRFGLTDSEHESLAVEDAWYNNYDSRGERRGVIHQKQSIEIGGVIVDLASARLWESLGKIPKGTVSEAKRV